MKYVLPAMATLALTWLFVPLRMAGVHSDLWPLLLYSGLVVDSWNIPAAFYSTSEREPCLTRLRQLHAAWANGGLVS